jgi:hypothetical protein
MLKRILKILGAGMILWGLTLLLPGVNIVMMFVVQGALTLVLGVLLAVVLFLQSSLTKRAECPACPVISP